MKKLILLALIANTLLLFSCQKERTTAQNDNSISSDAIGSYTGNCPGLYPTLPSSMVQEMLSNYRNKQQMTIEGGLKMNDANSSWFDLITIKNFICQLEEKVAQGGSPAINNLGLRFYYGAHTSDPTQYGLPASYAGKHNIVIIATYKDDEGRNIDFDPGKLDANTLKPLPLNLNRSSRSDSASNSTGDGDIFALDHGQLGPPY